MHWGVEGARLGRMAGLGWRVWWEKMGSRVGLDQGG